MRHPNSLKIDGAPGSGKTTAVIRLMQEHVDDGDFRLGEGIIVSFTRAAAHDIARRINEGGEPGRYHCTLHALCRRYYGFEGEIAETKLRLFMREEGIPYMPRARGGGDDIAYASNDADPSPGNQLMGFFNWQRNCMLPLADAFRMYDPSPELYDWWDLDRLTALWGRYVAWKRENRYADFTEMLEYAVENPPGERFPFFVLDEAQDCTALQFAVVERFAAVSDVCYLAGDIDQGIYSFIGADTREFMEAETTATDLLTVNHRSGTTLVNAAQQVIERNKRRFPKHVEAAREGGIVTESRWMPELDPTESTFVLARGHYLLGEQIAELQRAGYPFVEARGKYGVGGKASAAYERIRALLRGQTVTLDEWRLILDLVPSKGPWLMRGAKTRVRNLDEELRHTTYIRPGQLVDYGATADFVAAVRAGSMDPFARIDETQRDYLRMVEERYGSEYLEPVKARQTCFVGPIHAVKGLEADHVVLHHGMPPASFDAARIDPEPERRVMYVGMTRARERLTWLTTPTPRTMPAIL